jgi:peptidoglycan/LPS O-acetylase OafA/YrhL
LVPWRSPPASALGDHSYVAYLTVQPVDEFHARAVAAEAELAEATHRRAMGAS